MAGLFTVCTEKEARDNLDYLVVTSPSEISYIMKISNFLDGLLTEIPSHTHDDRYYTEDEVDALLLGLSGDAFPYVLLKDIKSSGSDGGSASVGFNVRDLNTEEIDTGGICTLSSNQFSLPAGDYRFVASAPMYRGNGHLLALYDSVGAAYLLYGAPGYADGTYLVQNRAFLVGSVTLVGTEVLELHHYASRAQSTNGLGLGLSLGINNTFSVLEIWKVG